MTTENADEKSETTTEKDALDDGWLAEQARDALSAIAALHDEAKAILADPQHAANGTEAGWFDPRTDAPKE